MDPLYLNMNCSDKTFNRGDTINSGPEDPGSGTRGPRDPGPGTQGPGTGVPSGTLDPGTRDRGPRDPGPGTQGPGTGDQGTRDPGTRGPGDLRTRGSRDRAVPGDRNATTSNLC